jgi:protein-glutamine gamma-glutamyltransferase
VATGQTAAAAEPAALRTLAWACAAFAGGVLLNIDRVPPWAGALALALIVWRLASARRGLPLPGTAARAVLALLLVAVVLLRYRTLNGLTAGTALLMVMAGLKLLETRARRDEFVMVGAGLFLLLAACLDRQGLIRAPLYALQAWLCCAALAAIATPGYPSRAALALAARALVLALPLAAALFLFFPRLQGSFWAVPRSGEALTGLSDSMNPGSIVQLVSSYEPAFRVQFSSAAPPPEERYWRGPVLHDFDGYTWRRSSGAFYPRQHLQYLGTPYRYRVSLEPTRQRWWFALDTPVRAPEAGAYLTYDNQLLGAEPVNDPVSYEVLSFTRTASAEALSVSARRQDTLAPPGNPRAAELAQTLRQRAGTDAQFVQATLEYLRTGGFEYSLTPERLGTNAIDDFLFHTRAGFCGHYASAFVALMRAAGVPAHVVTGYLGGEWNPIGGYFLVRQSDAHSWAEVWLEGRGWTRVDPTAVVAPERLRRGVFDLLPDALTTPVRLLRGSLWLTNLLQRWDAIDTWWSERVVKFDLPAQLDLLTRLGISTPDVRYLGWAFMSALCAWLGLIAWNSARGARPARDALARAYVRLCRKLARVAPARAPYQGPLSLADTVSEHRPDLSPAVRPLLSAYAQLRYGPPSPGRRARDIERFRRAVARLSLPRRAPALTRT